MKIQNEMPLSMSEIRSRLIFDQYSRYLPTVKTIQSIIEADESEILDIGSGDECILGQLLPEHLFTFIDPLLENKAAISENHKYIAGDIFCAELEEKRFSTVCTVDVFEHIPADFREQFLSKIDNLATDLIILSFPCKELESELLDEYMNKVYSSIFGKNYPWLDEHFNYGLPSSTDVELFFSERGWNTYSFGHGHLPWLQEFLSFSLVALDIPIIRDAVFEFSKYFNEVAVSADICPPFYRCVFIASKKEVGSQLNEIFSFEKYQRQLPVLTEQLKEKFYFNVMNECQNQSEYMAALKTQDPELAHSLLETQDRLKIQYRQNQQVTREIDHINEQLKVSQEKLPIDQEETANIDEPIPTQATSPESDEILIREEQLNSQILNLQAKIDRFSEKINSLSVIESELNTKLEYERYSILKPILRRLYRLARSIYSRMPSRVQSVLRKIKQRIAPRISSWLFYKPEKLESVSDAQKIHALNQILSCEKQGYDVFVFPVIDWHFRIQRPQHLATQLAQNGHRVFYFTTSFAFGDPEITFIEKIEERVFICQFNIPYPHPSIYEKVPTKTQERIFFEALDKFIRECKIEENVAIVDHPFWTPIALSLPASLVVYDCMDDHSGFHNTSSEILHAETYLLQNADLVITTSATLSEKIAQHRKNTLIRNAADSNWFSQPPDQITFHSDKPVIGYFGAISEWFDIDLIVEAAQAYPEYDFVLIGSTYLCDIKAAQTIKNIHFIGEIPYSELKGYLYAFDVCLIPFKLTELIHYTNPVKLYEYFASGKPVVATAMPELLLVKEHVSIAEDTESFINKIKQALESKDDPAGIQSRKEFALKNQWSNRVEKLEETIKSTYPTVSVIVLTYNNLEFTRACLNSLMEFTDYPNWELVIVDNASTDGSPEFLGKFAQGKDNVKLILNEENIGFAAGNNLGINNSTGEYIVLLNNDTYVTRGWLWGLIRYFLKDKALGLLGPVTNNIGNEAKIEIQYKNMEEMAIVSRNYTSKHSRQLFYNNTIAFFCAVIRRQVIKEIGVLDEVFGCGFFEDDDFCLRARNAGFKIAIADDVFIHHHLSASFSQLKEEARKELFDKNKAIYEEKWGTWVPHTYRS